MFFNVSFANDILGLPVVSFVVLVVIAVAVVAAIVVVSIVSAKQRKAIQAECDKVPLWDLFITFFRTGAFTFGGGYAMISILEEDLVEKKKWITSQDMLDMIVIAESTPGVIAVNTATSVGYRKHGVLGAIVATLGVVLPSFIIISALSFVINEFSQNYWYQAAFAGIQACVSVLIVNAFVKMFKQLDRDFFSYLLVAAAFAVAVFTDFDVIFLILIGGVLGLAVSLIKRSVTAKNNRQDDLPVKIDDNSRENK